MSLGDAEQTARELREQIADLVRAKQRAEAEAARLTERAALPTTADDLNEIGERYRLQAQLLAKEVEDLRATLRDHELDLERRRADEAGA